MIGCDELIKKNDSKPLNYSIRFHLYPGINAVQTIGKNSVLIQIERNKSTTKDKKSTGHNKGTQGPQKSGSWSQEIGVHETWCPNTYNS